MANGQRIAVAGVTGAVGQTTLKILEQRKFPVRELKRVGVSAIGRQDRHLRRRVDKG